MQTIPRLTMFVSAIMLSSATALAQSAPPAKTPPKTITRDAPAATSPASARTTRGGGPRARALTGGESDTAGGNARVGGNARAGGDDDLDDLEIDRRTVQGVARPINGKPMPKPNAGTSPNTGRAAGTTPPAPTPAGTPPKKP